MFTKFLKDPQNENVYDFYKPIYIQSQFFWLAPYSLAGERFSLKTYVLNQLLILLCLGCLMLQAFNDEVYIKRASSVAVVIYYQKSLTIIRMVVNVVAFLTSHYHAKVIGKILQVFHEFDEMTSQRYLRKSLGMRIQKLIIIQLPFLLVLSLTLQIVWDLYIEKQLVYSTIFQDISVTFCFIVQSQYLTILLLLQCRFKIIKEDLRRLLKLPKINPKEAINKCSILYEFLSKVAKETDEQFGMFIASVLFVEFIEFLDCAFILLYRFWLTGRAIFNKPILSELIVLSALIKSWINTTLFFTSAIFVAEKIYAEVRPRFILNSLV